MSLAAIAIVLIALTAGLFVVLAGVALAAAVRRPAAGHQISRATRVIWTLVPLAMVALVFAAVLRTGGFAW